VAANASKGCDKDKTGAGESALKSKTGEAACLDMSKVTACPPLTGRLKA
jgi:hypothetical protein